MPNARGQSEDHTYLSIDAAEEREIIHRDLLAHSLRLSHMARYIGTSQRYATAKVLDIGCGCEVPLGKMLYSNKFAPAAYAGVDARSNLEWPEMLKAGIATGRLSNWKLISADASKIGPDELGFSPSLIAAFEIVEHVEADVRVAILKNLLAISDPEAVFMLSTPNYDHRTGPAANHVDETTHFCLGAMIEDAGWEITARYGTFASIRDYKDELQTRYGDAGLQIFTGLRQYYDTNMLATVFAPLFPEQSRNILWELKKPGETRAERIYAPLASVIAASLEDEAGVDPIEKLHTVLGSSTTWESAEFRATVLAMLAA